MSWRPPWAEILTKTAVDAMASLVPEALRALVQLDVHGGRVRVPYRLLLPSLQDGLARGTGGAVVLEREPRGNAVQAALRGPAGAVELEVDVSGLRWHAHTLTIRLRRWDVVRVPELRVLSMALRGVLGVPGSKRALVKLVAPFLPKEVRWYGREVTCRLTAAQQAHVPGWLREASLDVEIEPCPGGVWLRVDADWETFPRAVGWLLAWLLKSPAAAA